MGRQARADHRRLLYYSELKGTEGTCAEKGGKIDMQQCGSGFFPGVCTGMGEGGGGGGLNGNWGDVLFRSTNNNRKRKNREKKRKVNQTRVGNRKDM